MAKNSQIVADIKDVKNNPDFWLKKAEDSLVIIKERNENKFVLLNAEEYLRLKRSDREVLKAGELSEEDIASIKDDSDIAEEAFQYGDELKDWKG